MKSIIGIAMMALLVGCSSTKSLNGQYDVDNEHWARGMAEIIRTTTPDVSEEFYLPQLMKKVNIWKFKAEVDFPVLRITKSYPDKPAKTLEYNLEQVDETHYTAIDPNEPEGFINFTYDPEDGSLTSLVYRLIKR
jgi:hypothetical protein